MTMTFGINEFSDISIVDGRLNRVYGPDEVVQRVLVTLRHFYGEYFLNLPGGTPWHELILGSKDRQLVEAVLRQVVLKTPGVISIVSFKSVFTNRALNIEMTLDVRGGIIVPVNFSSDQLGDA